MIKIRDSPFTSCKAPVCSLATSKLRGNELSFYKKKIAKCQWDFFLLLLLLSMNATDEKYKQNINGKLKENMIKANAAICAGCPPTICDIHLVPKPTNWPSAWEPLDHIALLHALKTPTHMSIIASKTQTFSPFYSRRMPHLSLAYSIIHNFTNINAC